MAASLSALGIPTHRGIGGTGVVATLRARGPHAGVGNDDILGIGASFFDRMAREWFGKEASR